MDRTEIQSRLEQPVGLQLPCCLDPSDHQTLTLKRLSYSLSGCDYDLYDEGGKPLLKVRGSGLRPDYLNSYYDSRSF
ncbi:hypothetical protein V865_005644 [Kwoniella europaea PYCC6329]|uniref:Uncharacterized protein n=1 Tax=Kwoniella europaea PYCC6329 TaxID=1423913 RepID=A0AAX4KMW2_9TREE